MNKLLKEKLESIFKDIEVNIPEDTRLIINVKKEQVLDILNFLKDKGYDHLALISCVDWIKEQKFELVYIIGSYGAPEHPEGQAYGAGQDTPKDKPTGQAEAQVILKTKIPRETPEFKTVIPVFENAEPYEREIHELFGINFKGHPRLTRLFLERKYEIPPFRKDFDTRKYVEQVFDKIPPVEETK